MGTLVVIQSGRNTEDVEEVRVHQGAIIRLFSHAFYTPPPFSARDWNLHKGPIQQSLHELAGTVRVEWVYP